MVSGPAPFFIAAGLLLLIVLGFFLKRSTVLGAGAGHSSNGEETLTALQSALLPREFVNRIFSSEDRDFVSRSASTEIRHMFDRERKTLALAWLSRTREQVAQLMGCYLKVARRNANLNQTVEIKLALHYALFQFSCLLLFGLIRLRGPVHTGKLVGRAASFAEQLGAMSEGLITSIRAAGVERVEPHLTNGSASN